MGSTTSASSSPPGTTGIHSSGSSTAPITPPKSIAPTTPNKTKYLPKAIPSTAPTSTVPLAKTHAVTTGPVADGSLEITAVPTESSSSTKGAKSSGGSDDDSKGSTYEIVSKVNPKTGKREYSLVWVEVTEKENPKRFLGYLKLTPTGNHDEPSPAAQAISALVEAAEAQNENFKKSSAQTTIKFDGVPAQDDEEDGYEIAILTRGKEKVTLDPKKKPDAGFTEKINAFHDEVGKIKKIIKQTGADFDPRGDKADSADGKKKEPKDISKEEIDTKSLNAYLNRVQQEGSSKIRLHPVIKLDDLNKDENIDHFKKVKDIPQFIPVEVKKGSYIYLCKDGTDLYYYNPKDEKEIESQPNKHNWMIKVRSKTNTICADKSSKIGAALHQFAIKHDIQQLHAPKKTQAGNHSSQAMGIQWLAQLSKLDPITESNAFIKSVPEEITVPEPSHGDDLSTEEIKQKKAAAKKEGDADAVAEQATPVAGPAEEGEPAPSLHSIFDGVAQEDDEITDLQKDAWLNALQTVIPKQNGSITPLSMEAYRKFVAPQLKAPGWWSRVGGKPPVRKWRTNDRGAIEALNKMIHAYNGNQENVEAPTITDKQAEFHAKILDNLVKDEALCKAFCDHKGRWGAPAEASAPQENAAVVEPQVEG